ncbi:hypothetical protein PQX77_005683 [Marasmius sp. AFHP31]|nr:hypothetical protein PQX77_005683 [Marasmius sp. AFHP31]
MELHGGYEVDLAEAQPMARIIYIELANKPKRYQAMANFVQLLLQYPSLFGSSEPRSSTSMARTSLSSSAIVPGSSRGTPYARTGKAPASSKHGVNTFLDPTSLLMPAGVSAWKSALESLSAHDNSLCTPDGVGGSYPLPPPRLFINPQHEDMKATLICNWLKLVAAPFKQKWRALLMIAGPGTGPSDPKRVSCSKKMGEVLQGFITKSSLLLKPNNLDTMRPSWNGQELEDGKLPSPQIVREIMHELFELNFRQEMVILDAQLDMSGMSTFD